MDEGYKNVEHTGWTGQNIRVIVSIVAVRFSELRSYAGLQT